MAGLLLAAPVSPAQTGLSAEAEALVAGNNRFALDLFRELSLQDPDNLFISPWSLSTALGMAWAGARGETADQMAAVLHFPFDRESTHPLFGEVIDTLNGLQEEGYLTLHTANALWPTQSYQIRPEYSQILKTHYHAHAETLDYVTATEDSRERINDWVGEKTRERIPELIPAGALDAYTRLVLTNAVYFKGAWLDPFNPDDTRQGVFYAADGEEISIDMMHMSKAFPYYQDADVSLLTLPYHGGQMEAILMLPAEGSLADLEASLTPDQLFSWLGSRNKQTVQVTLPRFTLRWKANLVQVLQSMGMQLPFKPQEADFSGIPVVPEELYISGLFHETFLQVNEEGTEAAGSTGVVIGTTSLPPRFRADRPFLFLIRDTVTGSLLFLGRVAQPEPLEDESSGTVDPETVKAYFGEDATLSDGWWDSPLIGRFQADKWPWIEHADLGWLYLNTSAGDPEAGWWLYDFSLGWLYSSAVFYPNFWSPAHDWICYWPGTRAPSWFFQYANGLWLTK